MTNGTKIRRLDDTALAEFILELLRGEGEPEGYDYVCTNCPAGNCTNFEPEERCCLATMMIWLGMEVDGEMETEELIQAANEIRKICDNADGCDECPFSRQDGLYSVVCKFFDETGGYCRPCEWSLNGGKSECQKCQK